MLGWEFPPIFSGGLGVATYGMVKALREKARIKLIIPANDASIKLDRVDIVGFNNITSEELKLEHRKFSLSGLIEHVEKIPVSISPYHHVNQDIAIKYRKEKKTILKPEIRKQRAIKKIQSFFAGKEVYGPNILRKVHLFAELADQVSLHNDFDLIHAHDWVTYPAGIKIKKRTGKPLILHVHALETDRAGSHVRNEIYWLEKSALSQADKIFAVSRFTKDQIIEHYNIPAEKIAVVHNGIDARMIERKPHKLKEKIVVFLGRITHQKGPQFLLETAAKVVKIYPDVKFVVAGMGDQFSKLLDTTAFRKLGRKFIFAGFLSKEKVDELLTMADVYFMPSVSEPFGLTALEAAQHFVPGVLSKQSGAGEVITASLQADYWDTDKHANYIYALLKYDKLHRELADKANTQISALTWEHAAEKISEYYTEVLERKSDVVEAKG